MSSVGCSLARLVKPSVSCSAEHSDGKAQGSLAVGSDAPLGRRGFRTWVPSVTGACATGCPVEGPPVSSDDLMTLVPGLGDKGRA
jgi:hypothetical protein